MPISPRLKLELLHLQPQYARGISLKAEFFDQNLQRLE